MHALVFFIDFPLLINLFFNIEWGFGVLGDKAGFTDKTDGRKCRQSVPIFRNS